jgi:hypothetical protein
MRCCDAGREYDFEVLRRVAMDSSDPLSKQSQ